MASVSRDLVDVSRGYSDSKPRTIVSVNRHLYPIVVVSRGLWFVSAEVYGRSQQRSSMVGVSRGLYSVSAKVCDRCQ